MNLTIPQREILERLGKGDRLIQNWDTGKCKWMPSPLKQGTPQPEKKAVVDSLHDQGYIYSRGFVFYPDGAYLDLELTRAGRTWLTK